MSAKVAIVDAYSAANQYPPHIKQRGHTCVHVQTSPEIPVGYQPSFRPNDFAANVIHQGSLEATAGRLKDLGVTLVIAGIETGVELADELSERLGLITNGTSKSEARRNKYWMQETIRAAGLRAIHQMKTARLPEALAWVKEHGLKRVVVKPLKSAGTDGVAICHSAAEVEKAFVEIFGKKNKLGLLNDEVLVQEFIEGTEFVVNTVSYKGVRKVIDIVRYNKIETPEGHLIYDHDDLLDETFALAPILVGYISKVLDALEINYGAAHAELFLTEDGPVLVEVAARCDGLSNTRFSEAYGALNQIIGAIDSYLEPEKFLEAAKHPLRFQKHVRVLFGISKKSGEIVAMPGIEKARAMRSFYDLWLKVKPGDRLACTTDLFTAPYYLYLIHEDLEVVTREMAELRALEASGEFFKVK